MHVIMQQICSLHVHADTLHLCRSLVVGLLEHLPPFSRAVAAACTVRVTR